MSVIIRSSCIVRIIALVFAQVVVFFVLVCSIVSLKFLPRTLGPLIFPVVAGAIILFFKLGKLIPVSSGIKLSITDHIRLFHVLSYFLFAFIVMLSITVGAIPGIAAPATMELTA